LLRGKEIQDILPLVKAGFKIPIGCLFHGRVSFRCPGYVVR
jgi:hypothetical protein